MQQEGVKDDRSRPWYGPGKQRMGQVVRSGQPVPSCVLLTLTNEHNQLVMSSWWTPEQQHQSTQPAGFPSPSWPTCLAQLARADRCML